MAIDATQFKATLAQWASGVTVVTTAHDGQYYGMTASSFSSVSLNPSLILICVAKKAHTHDHLIASGAFGVHILAAHQTDLGKRFAGLLPDITDRFAGLAITTRQTGSPILTDTLAWMDCRIHQTVEAGDHTVIIGEILDSQVAANPTAPLLYFNRQWGHFTPDA